LKKTSKLFKALADETRLRILKMLEIRPLCVCEIQYVLKASQPNVSHHLKTLSEAGLVEFRRNGLWIVYQIRKPPKTSLQAAILAFLRRPLKEDGRVNRDKAIVRSIDRVKVSLKK